MRQTACRSSHARPVSRPLRLLPLLVALGACGGGGGGGGGAAQPPSGPTIEPWTTPDTPLAPAQSFDFQPAGGPTAPGAAPVTPADIYDPGIGHGFTVAPESAVDGTGHGWSLFGNAITVEEAIPDVLLDARTIDCVSSGSGPMTFRVDVVPGDWDVVVWLGDVTTPRHQVRATVNGLTLDAERIDVNHRRGSFDETIFGNAVPLHGRVSADDGFIELTVASHPDGGAPIEWTYLLDEHPDEPPAFQTDTLVPAFSGAPLAALELYPAEDVPLRYVDDTLALADAPDDPALLAAVDLYNAGDVVEAAAQFAALPGDVLATARANGLLWCAGHPASWGHHTEFLTQARDALDTALALAPDHWPALRLASLVDRARAAEASRELLGFDASGAQASENLGRSCSLAETLFGSDQPYGPQASILWLRNRGGLDPRRVTVSWERAQWLAQALLPAFGDVNPYVRLYATDEWSGDDGPWQVIDWGELAGPGPEWARPLVRQLNGWLDVLEWWAVHRQSAEGDIGGGWTDDVEIMPAFGLLAYALEGSSDVVSSAVRRFDEGLWSSGVIDPSAAYQAAYADVEHSAEATGNMLHVVPLLNFADAIAMERIMASARTFDLFFLEAPDGGHRHVRGNHMSATQIAIDPAHRLDIPLCARIVAPFSFALWASDNPGLEAPLRDWTDAWLAHAASTVGGKPAGVFPNGVWVPDEGHGAPTAPGWWQQDVAAGQFSEFPEYHALLYGLAGAFHLRTDDPADRAPFDALIDLVAAWEAAGAPDPTTAAPSAGLEDVWAGAWLAPRLREVVAAFAFASGSSTWDDYLAEHGDEYAAFRLDPSALEALPDLDRAADSLFESWPYRTTEGVMTDRILEPGWEDGLAYALGVDPVIALQGLPVQAVTWAGASRLLAAAVTDATDASLEATVHHFLDAPHEVTLRCWQLAVGGDYELRAGPSTGPGDPPVPVSVVVPFHQGHRGDGPSFELPGRETWTLQIVQVGAPPGPPPLRADLALADADVLWDEGAGELVVTVHNVGAADAPASMLRLVAGADGTGSVLANVAVPPLEAPLDLLPRRVEVVIPHDGTSPVTLMVDPEGTLEQVTPVNDTVTVWLDEEGPSDAPPLLTGHSPASAAPGGELTLVGTGFRPGCTVVLDLVVADALTPTSVTDDEVVFMLPSGLSGSSLHVLSVRNPDGLQSNPIPLRLEG